MINLTIPQAFMVMPPRSRPVLCIPRENGETEYIKTGWFNWLNLKRAPYCSFSTDKQEGLNANLNRKMQFVLAFPAAGHYVLDWPVSAKKAVKPEESPAALPKDTGAFMVCTLGNAYNYPFKKVRIFNINIESAYGFEDEWTDSEDDASSEAKSTSPAGEDNEVLSASEADEDAPAKDTEASVPASEAEEV